MTNGVTDPKDLQKWGSFLVGKTPTNLVAYDSTSRKPLRAFPMPPCYRGCDAPLNVVVSTMEQNLTSLAIRLERYPF